MALELRNIVFRYGSDLIVDRFSCSIDSGEIIALMGLSGSGKSTLLRIIAGLELQESGTAAIFGKSQLSNRDVFYSLQDYDAFPWQTVWQNLAAASRLNGRSSTHELGKILDQVGLTHHAGKFPRELSGGMRKRLALGRAIANRARVLLLDEPFSSLDMHSRDEMYALLQSFAKQQGLTVVIVTHAVDEAAFLGSRILVCSGPPLTIVESVENEMSYPRIPECRESVEFERVFVAVQRAFGKTRPPET